MHNSIIGIKKKKEKIMKVTPNLTQNNKQNQNFGMFKTDFRNAQIIRHMAIDINTSVAPSNIQLLVKELHNDCRDILEDYCGLTPRQAAKLAQDFDDTYLTQGKGGDFEKIKYAKNPYAKARRLAREAVVITTEGLNALLKKHGIAAKEAELETAKGKVLIDLKIKPRRKAKNS